MPSHNFCFFFSVANSNTLSHTIWGVDIEELLTIKEEMEGDNNVKYKPLLDLCKRYEVRS